MTVVDHQRNIVIKKRSKKKIKSLNCFFCKEEILPDYKEPQTLRRFISERGKILSRTRTGACAKHQRKLTKEIKRARHLALLPFVNRIS